MKTVTMLNFKRLISHAKERFNKTKLPSRVLSLALVFLMILSTLPMSLLSLTAAASGTSTASGPFQVTMDEDTSTSIPLDFGQSAGDGLIWTDKSVSDIGDGILQVNLSAMAQEYISTAVSVHPDEIRNADVIFILDVSASMSAATGQDIDIVGTNITGNLSGNQIHRMRAMIMALNEAIHKVMWDESKGDKGDWTNNRVAVYTFGLGVDTLLPLNSYRMPEGSFAVGNTAPTGFGYGLQNNDTRSTSAINTAGEFYFYPRYIEYGHWWGLTTHESYRTNANLLHYTGGGTTGYEAYNTNPTVRTTTSRTDGQAGISYAIMNTITDIINTSGKGDFEKFGRRQPFIMLLGDGASFDTSNSMRWWAPYNGNGTATSNYNAPNVDAITNAGNNTVGSQQAAAVKVLTAAFMRDELSKAYKIYNRQENASRGSNPNTYIDDWDTEFFSIGLGSDTALNFAMSGTPASPNGNPNFAWCGLNPALMVTPGIGTPASDTAATAHNAAIATNFDKMGAAATKVVDDTNRTNAVGRAASFTKLRIADYTNISSGGTITIQNGISTTTNYGAGAGSVTITEGTGVLNPICPGTCGGQARCTVEGCGFRHDNLISYANPDKYVYTEFYYFANRYNALNGAFDELTDAVRAATQINSSPMVPTTRETTRDNVGAITFVDEIGDGMELVGAAPFRIYINATEFKESAAVEETHDFFKEVSKRTNELYGGEVEVEGLYTFSAPYVSYVVVQKETAFGKISVRWEIMAPDINRHTYKFLDSENPVSGSYATPAPLPIRLVYGVKLKQILAAADTPKYYFANAFENGIAEAYAEFAPMPDNPQFFVTSTIDKVGVVGKFADLQPPGGIPIGNFYKGAVVRPAVTDPAVTEIMTFTNIYVTSDMVKYSGGHLQDSDIGTLLGTIEEPFRVIDYKQNEKDPTRANSNFNKFMEAIENTIHNAVIAAGADDTTATYAFKTGVPQPEYAGEKFVVEDKANNKAGDPPISYLEDLTGKPVPTYINSCQLTYPHGAGIITRQLGNNGLLTLNTGVLGEATEVIYPGNIIEFTFTAFNYDEAPKTDVVIRSPFPTIVNGDEHTQWAKDAIAAVAGQDANIKEIRIHTDDGPQSGWYIEWTIITLPEAEDGVAGSADFKFTALVPADANGYGSVPADLISPTPYQGAIYKAYAEITSIGGAALTGTLPKSNETETKVWAAINANIKDSGKLIPRLDPPPPDPTNPWKGTPWTGDHGIKLVNEGHDFPDLTSIPPGEYQIHDKDGDTGQTVTVHSDGTFVFSGAAYDNILYIDYYTLELKTDAGTNTPTQKGVSRSVGQYRAGVSVPINITVNDAAGWVWSDWEHLGKNGEHCLCLSTITCFCTDDKSHTLTMPAEPVVLQAHSRANKVMIDVWLDTNKWDDEHPWDDAYDLPPYTGTITIKNKVTGDEYPVPPGGATGIPPGDYLILVDGEPTPTLQSIKVEPGQDTTGRLQYVSLTVIAGANTSGPKQSGDAVLELTTNVPPYASIKVYLPGTPVEIDVDAIKTDHEWYGWEPSFNPSEYRSDQKVFNFDMPGRALTMTASATGDDVEFEFVIIKDDGSEIWDGTSGQPTPPEVKLVDRDTGDEYDIDDPLLPDDGTFRVEVDGEDIGMVVILEPGEKPRYEDGSGNPVPPVIYYFELTLISLPGTYDPKINSAGSGNIVKEWFRAGTSVGIGVLVNNGYTGKGWESNDTNIHENVPGQTGSIYMPASPLTLRATAEFNELSVSVTLDGDPDNPNKPDVYLIDKDGKRIELEDAKGLPAGEYKIVDDLNNGPDKPIYTIVVDESGMYIKDGDTLTEITKLINIEYYTLTVVTPTGSHTPKIGAETEAGSISRVFLAGTVVEISAGLSNNYYWRGAGVWDVETITGFPNPPPPSPNTSTKNVTLDRPLTYTARAMPNYKIDINLNLDDSPWSGTNGQPTVPTIRLRPAGATDGSADITDLTNVPPGEFYVVVIDEGREDVVSGPGQRLVVGYGQDNAKTIDYYTLVLEKDDGVASTTGAGRYRAGVSINISAVVGSGSTWKDWSQVGGTAFNSEDANYTFVMPASKLTIKANSAVATGTQGDPTPPPGGSGSGVPQTGDDRNDLLSVAAILLGMLCLTGAAIYHRQFLSVQLKRWYSHMMK